MSDEQQACEVPLIEQLRSVPKDYRTSYAIQWDEDGRETGHRFIPVGFMMHRAADELEAAKADKMRWVDQAIKDHDALAAMTKRAEAASEQLHRADTSSAEQEHCIRMLTELNDELHKHAEEAERDAERYRWWRENRLTETDEACEIINSFDATDAASWDAAIDAARGKNG